MLAEEGSDSELHRDERGTLAWTASSGEGAAELWESVPDGDSSEQELPAAHPQQLASLPSPPHGAQQPGHGYVRSRRRPAAPLPDTVFKLSMTVSLIVKRCK